MRRDDVLRILAEHREEISEFGIERLALFGSVARDEARPGSDVDGLAKFRPEAQAGLFEVVRLKARLEELLGVPVDLVKEDALKHRLRERVLGEAIPAAWNLEAAPRGHARVHREGWPLHGGYVL